MIIWLQKSQRGVFVGAVVGARDHGKLLRLTLGTVCMFAEGSTLDLAGLE